MSKQNMNLPKAPKDLCFSEMDFIQLNFNVDTFLQEHKKNTKLETMRDDLGMYLKLLRSAMIDLINRDYNDFVNLSSNLIGLDKAINDLQISLGQLREEVMQIRQTLDDEISAVTQNMNESKLLREYKQSVYSLQHVFKSLNKLTSVVSLNMFLECPVKMDMLEQAMAEFNQMQFHISRCKLDIIDEKQKEARMLNESYMTHLNHFFLTCVQEKNSVLIIRCLRIYSTLDRISDAESLVRNKIVDPLCVNIINAENLQRDPHMLQNMYNRLLNILSIELKQLLDITLHPDRLSVRGFNFLVNSFWIDVAEKIEQHIKCIFAPGDPVLFHSRYVATLQFLEQLETECITPEVVVTLKENSQYKNFHKKWNLPVYFQIRFQEIASAIEAVLTEPISPASVKGTLESLVNNDFSLHTTTVIWDNLQRIWNNDVYLYQLFHRFWKFSLQICARYQTWTQIAVKEAWPVENKVGSSNKIEYSRLNFLISLYKDSDKLVNKMPSFLKTVRMKLKHETPTILKLLEDTVDEAVQNLEAIWPCIINEIVRELLKPCSIYLKQVSDIPRLFRRTKRDVPTKPCAYVKNSLAFLVNFHTDYKNVLPTHINHWLELALSSLTECYLSSVKDVLTSVQKTEESLRRLKKIRDKSAGSFSTETQGISDDEKIRIQLQVDVRAYVDLIVQMEIQCSNVLHIEELLQAVEAAVKK